MITVNSREEFLRKVSFYLPWRSTCVEIGVLEGDFSEMIFNEMHPLKTYLIDPYTDGAEEYNASLNNHKVVYSNQSQYERVLNRFDINIKSGAITVDRRFSHYAVNSYPTELFDFIYHDASHLQQDLKRDLETWFPKLKPGGLICGHDYIQHESFGVIQAVDEFCAEHNFEMIIFNSNGGDYALRKIQ